MTFARHLHLGPLSSEGSLACYTYCDTGHPFIWSFSMTRDTHIYWRAFGTTCLNDLGLSRLGFEQPTFRLHGELSSWLRHRRGNNLGDDIQSNCFDKKKYNIYNNHVFTLTKKGNDTLYIFHHISVVIALQHQFMKKKIGKIKNILIQIVWNK